MLQAALLRRGSSHFVHKGIRRCCCRCTTPQSEQSAAATMSSLGTPSPTTPEVHISVSPAGLGRITLCRDKQLNALGASHVEALRAQLLSWAAAAEAGASGVHAVLLDSNNDRSFCSGGDVKAARQAVLDSPYDDSPPAGHHIHRVFETEYSTVLLTAAHPSLVVCCQGIWMGLGFGIAGYAPYRIISDGTIFAMPENAIGLWPDVGFAFKAAHMQPHHVGLLLGLSGVRLTSVSDLLHYGIGTHYIPQDNLQAFKADLAATPTALHQLLQQYSRPAPDSPAGPLQRLMQVVGPHMQQLVDTYNGGSNGSTAAGSGSRDSSHSAGAAAGCDELQALHTLTQQLQQELTALHAKDHQACDLLQHIINGLQYASPRSLVITLQHFCRVQQAVAAAGAHYQQQQAAPLSAAAQHDNGSSSSNGSSSNGQHSASGCLLLPQPTWDLGVTVDGRRGAGAGAGALPDLSTLQGTMQEEYCMAVRQVAHVDFIEGVRAALVDKDRRPAWLAMLPKEDHDDNGNAAAAAGGWGRQAAQRDHQLEAVSAAVGDEKTDQQQPGNRFSVQHLFSPLRP